MLSFKWHTCVVFALVFVLSVECVDPNDRRHMSNRNGVVSKSRSMPGKWTSQNAVMSNVGAMFPDYSHGMIASPLSLNTMPSRFTRSSRSPRSRRSALSHLRHYNPRYFDKQYRRAQKRIGPYNYGGKQRFHGNHPLHAPYSHHFHHPQYNHLPFLPHVSPHLLHDATLLGSRAFGRHLV